MRSGAAGTATGSAVSGHLYLATASLARSQPLNQTPYNRGQPFEQKASVTKVYGSSPFSDACLIAMDYGPKSIVRDDWKKTFDDGELDKVITRNAAPRRNRAHTRVATKRVALVSAPPGVDGTRCRSRSDAVLHWWDAVLHWWSDGRPRSSSGPRRTRRD
jgi:phosphogluconate dehydrogenase-like protein